MPPPNKRIRTATPSRSQEPSTSPTVDHTSADALNVLPRPVPNQETQELFNEWRDAEAREEAARAHHDSAFSPSSSFLHPPSPAVSSAMSRTTSGTSTSSLANGMGGVAIREVSPVTGKRKAGRHGPLEVPTKARAAFLRKIGACSDCRQRKVKCPDTHHDLSLFEHGYIAEKLERERQRRAPQIPCIRIPAASQFPFDTNRLPAYRPQATSRPTQAVNPSALSTDPLLLGVGGGRGHQAPISNDQASSDLDQILMLSGTSADANPVSPLSPHSPISPIPQRSPVSPVTAVTPARAWLQPFWRPRPSVNLEAAPTPALTAEDLHTSGDSIPIGREVRAGQLDVWECQGGNSLFSGAHSVSSLSNASSVLPDGCFTTFASLEELADHFRQAHFDYRPLDPQFLYKCSACAFLLAGEPSPQCPNCDRTQSGEVPLSWEKWHYGSARSAASLASERLVSVLGGGGPTSHPYQSPNTNNNHTTGFTSLNGWFQSPNQRFQSHQGHRFGGGGQQLAVVAEKDSALSEEEDLDDGCGEASSAQPDACPLRKLLTPLDLVGLGSDQPCWGRRQPSRNRSRRPSSASSPSESSCPLPAAARRPSAGALLFRTTRWIMPPVLLLFFLVVTVTLQSPRVASSSVAGGLSSASRAWSRPMLCLWSQRLLVPSILCVLAGLLCTWLWGAVRRGRQRVGGDDAVTTSAVPAVGV